MATKAPSFVISHDAFETFLKEREKSLNAFAAILDLEVRFEEFTASPVLEDFVVLFAIAMSAFACAMEEFAAKNMMVVVAEMARIIFFMVRVFCVFTFLIVVSVTKEVTQSLS